MPASNAPSRFALLWRVRLVLLFFACALVASGLTAVPLVWEMDVLAGMVGVEDGVPAEQYDGLQQWIAKVREGVRYNDEHYPFIAYGTDWLAFAHVIIAVAMLGPIRDPVRNVWVVDWAMIACVAIFPAAFLFGPLRGIPFYWGIIDCLFGAGGLAVLIPTRLWVRRLERMG